MTHFVPLRFARLAVLPLAAGLLVSNSSTTYTLDTSRSSIDAKVPFLGLGSKTATFSSLNGNVTFVPNRPANAKVNVTINTRVIKAPDKTTLDRLKGEKFFWVDKYPTAKFVGTGLTMTDARNGKVAGTLTARGVTRNETLYVTFDTVPTQSMGKPINLTGRMTINRRNYGMTSYNLVVGKNVTISLKARMVPR